MKDKQAIKPDKIFFNLPDIVKDKEAKRRGVTDEERALAALAKSDGWGVLKEYIDLVVEGLDKKNDIAIASGTKLEEIGRNAVIISLAKGVIKQIVDKVLDSEEACEEPSPKKWGGDAWPYQTGL